MPFVKANISADPISLTLLQNEFKSVEFNITNTDTSNITVSFSHNIIKDNDNDEVELTLPNSLEIPASATVTAIMNLDVDGSMDIGTYTSTITLSSANITEDIPLTIKVTPGVCDFGLAGNSLKIDIKNPDNGDDFSPGDDVKISVKVDNDGADSTRVQIDAFLFNENNIIESVTASDEIIEDGEDETFDFYLTIPTLSTDVNEKEDFTLFIKAYDENDEKNECIQDSVSLDIKLSSHNIVIEDSSRFLPEVVSCGSEVTLIVDTLNLGKSNEDVKITVQNNELGISETSDTFEIGDFNSDEDNKATRTFNFDIPNGIKEKVYDFVVKALYSGETKSVDIPLQVVSCGIGNPNFQQPFSSASLSVQGNKLIKIMPKATTTVHVLVENDSPQKKTFFVVLSDVSEFAESSSETITLDGFKSANVFLPLTVLANAQAGTYSASINALEGVDVLASDTLIVKVEDNVIQPIGEGGFISGLSSNALIGLNILLIIIILVIIYLLKAI